MRKFKAKLIPVDGDVIEMEVQADLNAVCRLLQCDIFQTVRTADGMMLVDDSGLVKGLPQNPRASELYAGGYIAGPAVLFTQAEWEAYDAAFGEP